MFLALGLIETKGLVGSIEAADAMCKAANVQLVSKEKVSGALVVIKIIGEVAAVKSAVDAGAVAAQRVGQLISAHVIPRPDDQIEMIIYDGIHKKKDEDNRLSISKKETERENAEKESVEDFEIAVDKDEKAEEIETEEIAETDEQLELKRELEEKIAVDEIPPKWALQKLNVHELRKLARSLETFPIKGRDISKANRKELIDYFDSLR